jgi:hypothetical protein
MPPMPTPNLGLYHLGPSPGCLLPWILAPSDCCSRSFAPRATSPQAWPPGLDTPMLSASWSQHQFKNNLRPLLGDNVAQQWFRITFVKQWPTWCDVKDTFGMSVDFQSCNTLSSHLCLGLPSCLFPSGFPIEILHSFLISPCYMPRPQFPMQIGIISLKSIIQLIFVT